MSPEPPARKATSIPEPVTGSIMCTCMHVLQVVDGIARCCHTVDVVVGGKRQEIKRDIIHRVAITTELVGGSEGPVVDEEGAATPRENPQ